MPIYGYHCGRCGHEFEVKQSMSAAPLTDCPQCGGELRKLLYPVGVQFKGSGFYTTDYKTSTDGSKSSVNSSEEKTKSDVSSSSSNGSDGGPSSTEKKKTEPATSKE
jgi:putative FmdB family regulatory protein